MLNIHRVTAAFINEQPLHRYPEAFFQDFSASLPKAQIRSFDGGIKAITKGLLVRRLYTPVAHPGVPRSSILVRPDISSKVMRITGFGASAALQTFSHSTYGTITVQDYFDQHVLALSSPLKYPHLLVCNLGSPDKPSFVPMELLHIAPNQPFLGQLPEGAMAPMVKVAKRLPKENVQLINDAFKDGHMFDRGELRRNGIEVNEKMMEPKIRILPNPDLMYGLNSKLTGGKRGNKLRNGKWDLKGKKFKLSGKMGKLGIIEIGNPRNRSPNPAYEALAAALSKYGISGDYSIVRSKAPDCALHSLETARNSVVGEQPFVLIMLPGENSSTYDAVKWWADTQAGIHTICVTPKLSFSLADARTQANLATKFNSKAGGRNHIHTEEAIREIQQGGSTMILGGDVTHPGSTSVSHCPSIAAVVASVDRFAVNFPGSIRLQTSKQEKIAELKEMVIERIEVWLRYNSGALPSNILFYRDGVSDSQMVMVRDHDLAQIRSACQAVGLVAGNPLYDPKITLMVCGKRHHTRFCPTDKAKSDNPWVCARSPFRAGRFPVLTTSRRSTRTITGWQA